MKTNGTIVIVLASVAAVLCCMLVGQANGTKSKEVRDEKAKAIKDYLGEEKHMLNKRWAEDEDKASTTSTTKKPHKKGDKTGTTSTTKKPHKKGDKTTTTSKPSDGDDDKDKDKDKDKSTKKPSGDDDDYSTKSPSDVKADMDKEVEEERLSLLKQEDTALSHAIAGIEAWQKVFPQINRRTQFENKVGELLYDFETKFKAALGQEESERLMSAYLDRKKSRMRPRQGLSFWPQNPAPMTMDAHFPPSPRALLRRRDRVGKIMDEIES